MSNAPQLVRDDPWLEPYQSTIERRMARLLSELAAIEHSAGSLADHATAHHQLGIHYDPDDSCWHIREWAPAAKACSLIGDFNNWDRNRHPLEPGDNGIWHLSLPADILNHGDKIKLHITGADGTQRDRIPACIRRTLQDPDSHDYCGQVWSPTAPYAWLHEFDPSTVTTPLIYESHIGMAGEEPRMHNYREFADMVLPRIAQAGYNTVQLMAVQEHPYYGSFGYHVSSFFAASSRFGTPDDLKYLIDTAHGLGIAVLLDIVHSHAVKNLAEGLNDFDGSGHQYFHAGDLGEHPLWDSKCFDYSRPEVRHFLLSNVRYWLEEFHFDGFRFDGITSMLYHSRGNKPFAGYADYFGPDADEDAILYLQLATTLTRKIKPGALVIAEDMSGMPGLCRPVADGGVGFSHRLAMGIPDHWIKLLKHQRDEDWNLDELWSTLANRRAGEATIAYAESHDQALVGDKTLAFRMMDKEMYWHMAIDDPHPVIERGIALHKMIRLATLFIGGEGWLSFMGNEFGHPEWIDFPREGNDWSYQHCRRQWSLVDNPKLKYQWLAEFDRELMTFAQQSNLLAAPPAQCIHIDRNNQILVAERANHIAVFNFSVDRSLPDYAVTIHGSGDHHLTLDTDSAATGGHGRLDSSATHPVDTHDHQLKFYTPSRSAFVLAPTSCSSQK